MLWGGVRCRPSEGGSGAARGTGSRHSPEGRFRLGFAHFVSSGKSRCGTSGQVPEAAPAERGGPRREDRPQSRAGETLGAVSASEGHSRERADDTLLSRSRPTSELSPVTAGVLLTALTA